MNIVLTGSSTGIGRALAVRLLARGDRVWGIARTDQSTFGVKHPERFRFSRCDVAQWAEVEQAAAEVAAAWPHVDGVIAAAGLQGEVGRALSADPARWSATVRTNLDGTYFSLRAFNALLSRTPRRAKIICFSGGGATKPRPRFSAYGVAKTGVVRLVETIAGEERERALDINAIAPGAIHTRLTDEVLALGPETAGEAEYAAAQKTMAARSAQSGPGGGDVPPNADLALDKALGLVEWLLSPASDGISGRLLAAPWDPWPTLDRRASELSPTDIYTLRRVVPEDRGLQW
ncbi:MAG: SDR family NAD(P)-dependent oxidoreductase [Opitutaceae bacterium]